MKGNYQRLLDECHCWRAFKECPLGKEFLKQLYSWSELNPLNPWLVWKICDPCHFKEKLPFTCTVGFAHFFEGLVVYGTGIQTLFRSKHMRNRAGEFLGSVKCVIPVDASRILYEYIKDTREFKRRAWFRKRKIKKDEIKTIKRLTTFFGVA